MAKDDSPNGREKKHNLYRRHPRAHISALVLIALPEYKFIISGDRYDNVVYFLISSSISTLFVAVDGCTTLMVELPKSHNT